MDISKNIALIEALLIEDIPECDFNPDVELPYDENGIQKSPKSFDEIIDESIQQSLYTLEDENEADDETPAAATSSTLTPLHSANELPLAKSTLAQSLQSKKRVPEPNRKWKKRDAETYLPEYSENTSVVDECFSKCSTPTDVFLVLIDTIIDDIVYQSNLYATQNDKTLNLKKEELLAFIGMNFYMGYNTRPAWTDHYSSAPDLHNPLISTTMPRDRFAAILSNLHCNDNSKIPPNCKDKLYKIRPVVDQLNQKFHECYHGTRELSVDESMIKFKGRSVLKQYLPMKPIKRGYKLWCLADQRGFIKKFIIYQGKNTEISAKFSEYTLGERVVLELTEKEWGKKKLYILTIFSPLFRNLKS